ncbi:hypothetical protein [Enterococcus sp. BWR-S5]|uniref:hypothetical protein n=1 Tax=Enterococcus sp. BWR-S5 TaxID=2787714 RepID=UPI0019237EAC|nr:hypothetical protein [Enterococcus sp. BWR-S5]MBL1227469.1 hypothetical protein [Enterococcus sp. BWR-S5]
MKCWKLLASMSVIFLGGVVGSSAAQAEKPTENYIQFSNTDLLEQVLAYKGRNYIDNKYATDVEKFEIEFAYAAKEESLNVDYEAELKKLEALLAELDSKLSNGELSKEEYDKETEKIDLQSTAFYEEKEQKLELLASEYEQGITSLDKTHVEESDFLNTYGLVHKNVLPTIEVIDLDWCQTYNNIAGFENFENVKKVTGEFGASPILDIRPFRGMTSLEYVRTAVSGVVNLDDFKNNTQLKVLELYTVGNSIGDEGWQAPYTQPLLTDISALSELSQLNRADISTQGILTPVTMKKDTTSYQLYDPIILSSQFEGAQLTYCTFDSNGTESTRSNEELVWSGLTGKEEFLAFEFDIQKGNFFYSGEGQIPLRWK